MNLSREQLLAEMGISPLWRLRHPAGALPHQPTEARTEARTEAQPVAQPVAARSEPAGIESAAEPAVRLARARIAPGAADAANGSATQTERDPPPRQQPGDAPNPGRREIIARLDWPGLKDSSAACRACVLCEHRRQAVLGVGDVAADWLFIGEGPGAEEDVQGEPFVGQAGKLLDNMLAAIDLKRGENVYIANAVKCRPPGNRTPTAEEMAACRPYLERQIELMAPRLIVLLGKAAVSTVLGSEQALGSLRGKRFDYRGIPVVVTYHPAYLLRNLPEKAKAWEDLVFARRLMRERQAERSG